MPRVADAPRRRQLSNRHSVITSPSTTTFSRLSGYQRAPQVVFRYSAVLTLVADIAGIDPD
jgi:hypothetical protein